jgi:hypothetical protein
MFCKFGSLELKRPVAAPGLIEARVYAAVTLALVVRQRVEVRALELHERAVLEHELRHRVHVRQALEHFDVGAVTGLGLLHALEAEPREEHFAELLRRVDVELAVGGRCESAPRSVSIRSPERLRLLDQRRLVDRHACPLHLYKDVDQRQLDLVVQLAQHGRLVELFAHHLEQPPGDVRVLAGVAGDVGQRHAFHRDLVFAGADELGRRDLLEVEQVGREPVDAVLHARRVQQEGGDHRVHDHAAQRHAERLHREDVVLDVVPDLPTRSSSRIGLIAFIVRSGVDDGFALGPLERHGSSRALGPRKAHADDVGAHRP